MNNCILMAEIVQEPQLRYTPEQSALAEMLVQFPGLRAEDPPATLKVVGWGNLAQQIQQNYRQGDRVVIEGRLSMNTIERDGFKEKRAELTAQRVHSLGDSVSIGSSTNASTASGNANSELHSVESRNPEKVATRNVNSDLRSGSSLPKADATASTVSAATDFASDDVPAPQSKKPQSPTYPVLPSEEQDIDDIPF